MMTTQLSMSAAQQEPSEQPGSADTAGAPELQRALDNLEPDSPGSTPDPDLDLSPIPGAIGGDPAPPPPHTPS